MNLTDPTAVAADVARYVAIVGAGIPLVWAVSEALGKLMRISEATVACVIGPVYAFMFLVLGYLPILDVQLFPGLKTPFNILWAVLAGLASSGGAKILNDKLAKPRGFKIPVREE